MFKLGYGLSYLAPVLTLLCFESSWLPPFWVVLLAFLLIPIFDELGGDDTHNPEPGQESQLEKNTFFNSLLYVFAPVQWALLLWACHVVEQQNLSWQNWVYLLLLVGVVNGGLSINTAHELCHRKSPWEQFLAKALWFRVGYLHFHIEHVQGHHPRIGTPEDPATARLGESVYAFYLRCIPGTLRSAWQIERKRLKCLSLPLWSWRNQMLWFLGLPLLLCAGLYGFWGLPAVALYLIQALLSILTLETINYIEHYGLLRQKTASGRYEKIGKQHSWNSHRRLTNYFLFNLQRHSDHHMHAQRKYPILRAFPDSPQLPAGYGTMFLLALFPPLWRRVMDQRALKSRESAPQRGSGALV